MALAACHEGRVEAARARPRGGSIYAGQFVPRRVKTNTRTRGNKTFFLLLQTITFSSSSSSCNIQSVPGRLTLAPFSPPAPVAFLAQCQSLYTSCLTCGVTVCGSAPDECVLRSVQSASRPLAQHSRQRSHNCGSQRRDDECDQPSAVILWCVLLLLAWRASRRSLGSSGASLLPFDDNAVDPVAKR